MTTRNENAESSLPRKRVSFETPPVVNRSFSPGPLRPLPPATAPVSTAARTPLEATAALGPADRPANVAASAVLSNAVATQPVSSPLPLRDLKPGQQTPHEANVSSVNSQDDAAPCGGGTMVDADGVQPGLPFSGNEMRPADPRAPVSATPDQMPPVTYTRAPWNADQDRSGMVANHMVGEQRSDLALSPQPLSDQVYSSIADPASAVGTVVPLPDGGVSVLPSSAGGAAGAVLGSGQRTAPQISQLGRGGAEGHRTNPAGGTESEDKPPSLSEGTLSEESSALPPLVSSAPRLARTASASETLPAIGGPEVSPAVSARYQRPGLSDRGAGGGPGRFSSAVDCMWFPGSAPPAPLESRAGFSPSPRALRSPYYIVEGLGCNASCYGTHRVCVQGSPQRATPALRTTSWSADAWELAYGVKRTGGFWRDRARRLNLQVGTEEGALRTRPPPGTEQRLRAKSPKTPGGGTAGDSAPYPDVGKGVRSGTAERVHPLHGPASKRGGNNHGSSHHRHDADLFLAEAQDAIRELESALIGQDIRNQGEQMLREGCIAYQDESIRLLRAHIQHLSQDLEACAQNQTLDRRESAMLLRHLRMLRRLRGTRQGNLTALHNLYSKLRAAREESQGTLLVGSGEACYETEETAGVTGPSEGYSVNEQELHPVPRPADADATDRAAPLRAPEVYVTSSLALPPALVSSAVIPAPSPDRITSAVGSQSTRLRQVEDTLESGVRSPAAESGQRKLSLSTDSQTGARGGRHSDQVPQRKEQDSQTTFLTADKVTEVSEALLDSRSQYESVGGASKSVTGLPPAPESHKCVLVDAATGMSDVGFDELLGDREVRLRREEEERLRTRQEVLLIQQQREEIARQQREEELVLEQQQEQLRLLMDQERVLRLHQSAQEKLEEHVTKKLEEIEAQNTQLALQAHQMARREELRKLIEDATTAYPFAPGERTDSPGMHLTVSPTTLPLSPLPRTASPLVCTGTKGRLSSGSPERALHEGEATLQQRGGSPFLLLTSEETKAREDFRLANEQLQKRCAELHAQVTYLQMAGAGLSQEQVDFVEQQLAEQKAYNAALEKQNKELVAMAEKALKDQEAGLAKEWGARLREVEAERDLARAAVKDGGQKSKLEVSEMERKFEAAERTKEDALARLVAMEREQREREEEVLALRRQMEELERTAAQEKASLQLKLEELSADRGEERELMKSQYQQALEESSLLKKELQDVKQENERAKSVMRSRVASLAEQLERDQQEKEEVVNFVRLESQTIHAKLLSEAETTRNALESRLEDECRKNEALKGRLADLETQVGQRQREKEDLENELARLRGDGAKNQADTEALLKEKDKRIGELEVLSEALKADLDASRMAADEVEGHFRAHRDAVAKKHLEEVERMMAERAEKEKELNERLQAAQKMQDDLKRKERELNDKLEAAEKQSGDREQKERELSDKLRESQVMREEKETREKELQEKLRAAEEEAKRDKEGREQAEKEKAELEEKLAKLSEMSAKQHFERERLLQKHLHEKDVLRQSLARIVEESKELQSKYEGELKTRTDSFQKEFEDRQKQFDELLRHATESAEAAFSRQATLEENLSKVLKQHERDVENHKRALSHSELQRNMSIDGLKRRHRETVDALSRQAEQRIRDVREEYEKALATQKEQLEQANADLKRRYTELLKKGEDSMEEMKKKHQAEIEELTRKQEEKLLENRRRSEAAVDELRRRNTADLEDAKQRLDRTTADFMTSAQEQRQKAEKTTAELNRVHKEELQKLHRKFEAEIDDMKKALESAKKAAAAERSQAAGGHADRFRRALQETVSNMQRELDTITRKLEDLRNRNRNLEKERGDLLKAKKDLEEGMGAQAKDRAELEDRIQRLQNRVEQLQGSLEAKHKQIEDLEKKLEERGSQMTELKSALHSEKALTVEKEEKLKRAAETIRVLKNQETKQRELAMSLTSQLEAKERSYANLEAEVDNMQDKLRSKDQNDLEAQSHMRRKVMNLEHELEDQRRGNVELKRAKEQVEKENAQLKENLKSLQSQLRRLKDSSEKAASSTQEQERLRVSLEARVAELEQQVTDLERKAEEQRHLEAKLRAQARRIGEEMDKKTSELSKLKQELAATKEKVGETNRRMRQSISDFAKEQEEVRARMARDFAKEQEEDRARMARNFAKEQEEDRARMAREFAKEKEADRARMAREFAKEKEEDRARIARDSAKEQEEVRARMARDFARREEELLARCRASEDRNFEAQSRISELQTLVDRLSAKAWDSEKSPVSSSVTAERVSSFVGVAADVSTFLRHAVEELLKMPPFVGSGVEVGKVISEMQGMLPASELTDALVRLVPWTSRSALESLLGRIVTSEEAGKLLDTQGEECCPRLTPQVKGLVVAVQNDFRVAKTRRQTMDTEKLTELIDVGASPLEVLDLLRTVGSAVDGAELVALLGRILPQVPVEMVASVLANTFHEEAVATVGEGLGAEFAEFLNVYVESEHFKPLIGLLGEGIKQLKALSRASSSLPTGAAPGSPFSPPAAVSPYPSSPGFLVPYPVYPMMPGQSLPASPSAEPLYRPSALPPAEPLSRPSASPSAEPLNRPSATPSAEPLYGPFASPPAEPLYRPFASPPAESLYRPFASPEPVYQQVPAQRSTASPGFAESTFGAVAPSVAPVSSLSPGVPRLYNVSAKLSYKLLARKTHGQGGHRDGSRQSSPMQRVLSECSTN